MRSKTNWLFTAILAILTIVLRLRNLTPFKIYPDSYVNLLIARNLSVFHNVVGTLGKGGMIFPDFFTWTRSVYPLLINAVGYIAGNNFKAAYLVTFLLSALSVPLTYMVINKIFKNSLVAVLGSLLIAISFNHVVWSGFILTESVGVFFALAYLWSLISSLENDSTLAEWRDLLTGAIFGLMVFCRYEYAVLIIPSLYLILVSNRKPVIKIVNIFTSLLFVSSLVLSQFYSVQQVVKALLLKSSDTKIVGRFHNGLDLRGIYDFFKYDFLILPAFVIGAVKMAGKKELRRYLVFSIMAVVLLYPFYYMVNPLMSRYVTHLLPYILIPASYGIFILAKGRISKFIIILLAVVQLVVSFQGARLWKGEWNKTSYDEEVSVQTVKRLNQGDDLLLVSFPEAYSSYTDRPTYSVIDKKPFIYIPNVLDSQRVAVVIDMGMRDIFPNFTSVAINRLKKYKSDEYKIGRIYHYGDYSIMEKYPAAVYRLTVSQLKSELK